MTGGLQVIQTLPFRRTSFGVMNGNPGLQVAVRISEIECCSRPQPEWAVVCQRQTNRVKNYLCGFGNEVEHLTLTIQIDVILEVMNTDKLKLNSTD